MSMGRRGKGEGSIYQRRDGRWEGQLTVRGLDGRPRRHSVYGRSRPEVQKKLRKRAEVSICAGDHVRVGTYLSQWVEGRRASLRPSTFRSYHGIVHQQLIPALGAHRLGVLSATHVQTMMQAALDGGRSPRSVRYDHAVLRKALEDAVRTSQVPDNVAKWVTPPRVPHFEAQPFSEEELTRLGAAVNGHWLGPVVAVTVGLGLRQGEVLGLRWKDVDLDRGVIYITGALQRVHGSLARVEPKTRQSRRALRLSHELVSVLQARRSSQAEERQLAGPDWQESGYVFTTRRGTPRDGRNVTRQFQAIVADANLGHRRFHDLRHTAGSMLVAEGIHMRVVMETLGHSQIAQTMNTYAHVLPPQQTEVATTMGRVLARSLLQPSDSVRRQIDRQGQRGGVVNTSDDEETGGTRGAGGRT
jgi:integrase